jgi:predicted CopG family antitoxin
MRIYNEYLSDVIKQYILKRQGEISRALEFFGAAN